MRMFAIAVAVLLAGAAVAVVVLRGRTDDFASALEQRPGCWVKVQSSEPGKCPHGVGRIYKGECYMANWAACSKSY
ncbi:hypothetical protein D7W81_13815 [Corallococcus aberystwythensis]|uniref:Uncharacterized protein n=1 Tax=Corallococcus aberystwythensis TaxID=2316722 RepID=A0A3A8QFI6_9BACT|nr:hypothetical protein D7W81_13815 [Corallococcus aberystwythensis]